MRTVRVADIAGVMQHIEHLPRLRLPSGVPMEEGWLGALLVPLLPANPGLLHIPGYAILALDGRSP